MAAYWIVTMLVAFELVASEVWSFLDLEYVRVNLARLGYPPYFPRVLAIWDLAGAVTLPVPRFWRLKEWAYAGAFFSLHFAPERHALDVLPRKGGSAETGEPLDMSYDISYNIA
jgi:hypothetical protein